MSKKSFDLTEWANTAKELQAKLAERGEWLRVKFNAGTISIDFSTWEWPVGYESFESPHNMHFKPSLVTATLNPILGKPCKEKDADYGTIYTWAK